MSVQMYSLRLLFNC